VVAFDAAPASLRDPSTTVFMRDGAVYLQIHHAYARHYDHLVQSGLYKSLVDKGLLIPHEEIQFSSEPSAPSVYKVLQPELVTFISYPQEWSFSQLKDAALATLTIQKIALEFGMLLKDATTFTIQFHQGKPVLIDTGSFQIYEDGLPWPAYGQFCRHFLAPLSLMTFKDIRLTRLFQIYPDGIPLDLAASLLPTRSFFSNLSLFYHIAFHAKTHNASGNSAAVTSLRLAKVKQHFNRSYLTLLAKDLESIIRGLRLSTPKSNWSNYYHDNTYTDAMLAEKKALVSQYLDRLGPNTVWDLGANTGVFSKIACQKNIETIAMEMDAFCVELLYVDSSKNHLKNLLPLVVDLTNPTPDSGWDYSQQQSLAKRGPADTLMALALIHHLAVANSIPLNRIAHFFAKIGKSLIIEFVPKSDSQVQSMLTLRDDIFPQYSKDGFEQAFSHYFSITQSDTIPGSNRILYMMTRRPGNELPQELISIGKN